MTQEEPEYEARKRTENSNVERHAEPRTEGVIVYRLRETVGRTDDPKRDRP